MNTKLEKYLDKVDGYLKPLPTSERVDIIKEIQSSILEMESENLSPEQIINRLGEPKDLAKAYIGDLLVSNPKFTFKKILAIFAFYSLVSFSGLIIIPTLGIIAPTFILCGIICPILGAVKMFDYIFKLGLPFMSNIGINIGGVITFNPILEFFIILIVSLSLLLIGFASWKLLVFYCKNVSKINKSLL